MTFNRDKSLLNMTAIQMVRSDLIICDREDRTKKQNSRKSEIQRVSHVANSSFVGWHATWHVGLHDYMHIQGVPEKNTKSFNSNVQIFPFLVLSQIISEHFGENRVTLWLAVVKLRCNGAINSVRFFLNTLYITKYWQWISSEAQPAVFTYYANRQTARGMDGRYGATAACDDFFSRICRIRVNKNDEKVSLFSFVWPDLEENNCHQYRSQWASIVSHWCSGGARILEQAGPKVVW